MTTGEYIDTLLEEIETLKDEPDLYQSECEHILKVIFTAIETPSYINPSARNRRQWEPNSLAELNYGRIASNSSRRMVRLIVEGA